MDLTEQPIPVIPAAHYMCGGVRTDLHGKTDLPGLFAAGEVTHNGFHGANRLASNSLLESLAFSRRAFEAARADGALEEELPALRLDFPTARPGAARPDGEWLREMRQQVQRTTWDYVGIERSDAGLEHACEALTGNCDEIEATYRESELDVELVELRNTAAVAHLVAQSARMRKESRGAHFNRDHPVRDDDNWQHDTLIGASR